MTIKRYENGHKRRHLGKDSALLSLPRCLEVIGHRLGVGSTVTSPFSVGFRFLFILYVGLGIKANRAIYTSINTIPEIFHVKAYYRSTILIT